MGTGVSVGIGADVGTGVADVVGPGVAVGANVGDAAGEGSGSDVGVKVRSGWAQANPTTKSASGTTTTSLIVTWLLWRYPKITSASRILFFLPPLPLLQQSDDAY